MLAAHCPFCEIVMDDENDRIVCENDFAIMVYDAFPITRGHSLIIPKQHIGSFFETNDEEKTLLMQLLEKGKRILDEKLECDSYNIGINDGPAAGQTIPHLHIHLIPRYIAEDSDPRGGVRWIVPEKANYWSDK